ncbi:MAG: hypothetical protein ACFFBL_10165 [Promethearchaeota archaeon]
MNQELGLAPRGCAINASVFLIIKLTLGLLIYFILNTIFPVPRDSMLGAMITVKTNGFLLIGVIGALCFMTLFNIIVAFPLNNVLTSIDKDLSKRAQQARWAETFFFVAGMVLLFTEIPDSIQVLFVSLAFYAICLILIGILVFISGYLSRVLGASLILGGFLGFIVVTVVHFQLPSLVWVSTIGALCFIIPELSLAITFLNKAMRIVITDPKETITTILMEIGEATTAEIIDESAKVSAECADRIPEALRSLEEEKKITKRLSKEKKGYVWSLVL